uniref:Uncharacterized protein n=1 Tax=Panstrongylus lignarius TaxID=156445 RepID=A0A224Y2N7_9HEMI
MEGAVSVTIFFFSFAIAESELFGSSWFLLEVSSNELFILLLLLEPKDVARRLLVASVCFALDDDVSVIIFFVFPLAFADFFPNELFIITSSEESFTGFEEEIF